MQISNLPGGREEEEEEEKRGGHRGQVRCGYVSGVKGWEGEGRRPRGGARRSGRSRGRCYMELGGQWRRRNR